jgi:hypothetical protein
MFRQTSILFLTSVDPQLLLGHLVVVEPLCIRSGVQAKFEILVAMFGSLILLLEVCLS